MLARLEFLSMLLPMFTGPPGDIEAVRALQAQVAGTLPAWPDALSQAGVAFVLQGMGRFEEARPGSSRRSSRSGSWVSAGAPHWR